MKILKMIIMLLMFIVTTLVSLIFVEVLKEWKDGYKLKKWGSPFKFLISRLEL